MRVLIVVVLIVHLPLPLLPAPAAAVEPPAGALVLSYFGADEVPASIWRTAGAELQRLFRSSGLQLRWRDGMSAAPAPIAAVHLRVIVVTQEPQSWGLDGATIGAVLGGPRPASAIFVFYRNLLRVIGTTVNAAAVHSREAGKALGRVIAHELVHALAPEHRHEAAGLMSRSLDRRALVDRPLRIDSSCLKAAIRGLMALAGQ